MTDHTTSERVRELETELAALRAKLEAEQQPRFEPGDVLRWVPAEDGDDGLRFMSGRKECCYGSFAGYGEPNEYPSRYTKIATLRELVEFWEQHADLRTKRKPLSECVDAEDIVKHYKGVKLRMKHWPPDTWMRPHWSDIQRVHGEDNLGISAWCRADSLIENGEIYHD